MLVATVKSEIRSRQFGATVTAELRLDGLDVFLNRSWTDD